MNREHTSAFLLFILGFLLLLSSVTIVAFIDTDNTGSQLCVDGNNNKNLEGIMCESTTYYIFEHKLEGQTEESTLFLSLTLFFLIGFLLCLGAIIKIVDIQNGK